MTQRYFEDFTVGDEFHTAGCTMTESDIIDFALKYDCQPFHMDVEAAKDTIYGGLIASGWHVVAVAFGLFTRQNVINAASLGSPGLDELRWKKPVRPGDTITMHARVAEVRPSRSKPDRGSVLVDWWVTNQNGEEVMTLKSIQLVKRRDGGA